MMILEQEIQTARSYQELWEYVMPGEQPPSTQFVIWLGMYGEINLKRGILRAANKAQAAKTAGGPMTLSAKVGYAVSVMNHESRGVHRVPANGINRAAVTGAVIQGETDGNR